LQLLCIPQVFWFSAIGQAAFIAFRSLKLPLGGVIRDLGRGLSQLATAGVWAAVMLAVVLFPFLELITQSNRSHNTADFVGSYSLAWKELAYLFNPLAAGVSWEANLFVGAGIVVLGCAGLARFKERNTRRLLGMLLVALLITLGDRTPAFGFLYRWLPGFADFRIHARTGILVDFALICSAGIWLSRPHPRLQSLYSRLCVIPIRATLAAVLLLVCGDLVQGDWAVKRIISHAALYNLSFPLDRSFEDGFVATLSGSGLLQSNAPPPQVLISPALVPANDGMVNHYANCDGSWALLLRRPWDYLHAAAGVQPGAEKGYLSSEVYNRGPFPYPELSLGAGFDPGRGAVILMTNPVPRAFLVTSIAVADYQSILRQLTNGFDTPRSALVETPIAEIAHDQAEPSDGSAEIRSFRPASMTIDVDAPENRLLIVREPWYPGWQADIDGRIVDCVPANLWMRAVPISGGRHTVRMFFHQDYLLSGLILSLAGLGLIIPAYRRNRGVREPGRNIADPLPETGKIAAVQTAELRPFVKTTCTAVGLIVAIGTLVIVEKQRAHSFAAARSHVDALMQFRLGELFAKQRRPANAVARYAAALQLNPDYPEALNNLAWIRATDPTLRDNAEALRLASRACDLTEYHDPQMLGTLATALVNAGRLKEGIAAARKVHELALAKGDTNLAEQSRRFIEAYESRSR
jgi:hypothetical protein